jgi:hypothetical protein
MPERHEIPTLPAPFVVEDSAGELRVALPDGPSATFRHLWLPSLTRRSAEDALSAEPADSERNVFVSYRRSSPEARQALRDAGISFAGDDGRVFICVAGIYVDRDEPLRRKPASGWEPVSEEGESVRNPFAKTSSRVPRWLLLHHRELVSAGAIATAVELNPATVSRVVRTLEDAALVREAVPNAAGRRRDIQVERPRALLDTWLPHWQRRRIRQRNWDIGARDTEHALSLLAEAKLEGIGDWAVGGVAGAATVRRAVEPSSILVWATQDSVAALGDVLAPEPGRRDRGSIRIAIAPDPWTLRLADTSGAFPVADRVQLWLDCASEGERALEAASAVAEITGWS